MGDAGRSDFEHFYEGYYLEFVRLATLLTGSQADAEDVVQESFMM